MRKTQQQFSLSLVSVALLAAFGNVQADEIETLTKPASTVSVGIGGWSGERKQFETYDGMEGGDTYALVDADINKRDDATGTWLKFSGKNLGLDSRELRAEFLRQGDVGVILDYSRTPRVNPFSYNTGLTGVGATSQTVTTVSAGRGRNVELGTVRDGFGLKVYKALSDTVDFNVNFKNEKKEGTRAWGRGGGLEFAVEPIDATTREIEAVLSYSGKEFQISGGYLGNWYTNANDLVVSNGAACSQNAGVYANICHLSLPLDNEAHQLFVDAGFDFTPTTRGMLKASYGTASQKEDVATDNINLGGTRLSQAGSVSNIDGRINTTLVQLGLTSRPMPKLALVANLRYNDVADITPIKKVVSNTVYNTPQSYTTTSGKVDATYQVGGNYSLNAGLDYSDQDRSYPTVGTLAVPFRANLTETTYRAQVRRALDDSLNGSIGVQLSDRVGDFYAKRTSTAAAIGTPGGLYNPLHIADRQREKARLSLDWAPADKASLQFVAETARDRYDHGREPMGLQSGGAEVYSLDGSYAFNDDWSINSWLTYDKTRANQRVALNTTMTLINDVRLEEISNAFGLGLTGKVSSKVGIGANVEWTQSTSKFFQSGAGANLDAIHSDTFRIKLNSTYALRKNAELRFDVIHEYWSTDDWTWTFFNSEAFRYSDGTTVTADQKQTSNFFGARYVYHFQ